MYIYIRFLSGTDVRDRLEHNMVIIIARERPLCQTRIYC